MIFEQRSCLERERKRMTFHDSSHRKGRRRGRRKRAQELTVANFTARNNLMDRRRTFTSSSSHSSYARLTDTNSPVSPSLLSSPLLLAKYALPAVLPRLDARALLTHCSRIGQSVIHNADDRGFLFYIYNKTGVDEKKEWKGRASRRDKTWPGQRWGQNRDPSVFPWGEEGGYVIPAGEWRRQRTGWQIYGHLSLRSRIRNRSTDRDRCVSIAREKIRFFRFVVNGIARLERRKERLDVRVIEAVTTWIV